MVRPWTQRLVWVALMGLCSCPKVPLVDIHAGFVMSDAVWFEDEQTLFVFYRVEAQQGIEPLSLLELRYRTDAEERAWTPLQSIASVHTHLSVDCGAKVRCGSWSLKVPLVPRQVGLRLRYHPQGSLALDSQVAFFKVESGPPHSNRSLVLYGVFDETNTRVQWRARHTFPNLRNHQVEEMGLRRHFRIWEERSGNVAAPDQGNQYWYAVAECPGQALGGEALESTERARFSETTLPVWASNHSTVCAKSLVQDGRGPFEAVAVARKNPEVRAAFPALRSPVRPALRVSFLLRPCHRTISNEHLAMQEQRLLLEGAPTICLDSWQVMGFSDSLATQFRAALDSHRGQGQDMVLSLALHHDDTSGRLARVVANALAAVLVFERDLSTPRGVGAFVFDSYGRSLGPSELSPLVLWCPALTVDDLDQVDDASQRACPLMPDIPDISLGPFRFSALAILPTRTQYLTFISKYGAAQAGKMKQLDVLAPQLTAVSQNVSFGASGVATFFNNEIFTPAPTDALSYCASAASQSIVFRTPGMSSPMGLDQLPDIHQALPEPAYSLGLVWDSPFLVRVSYEVVLGGQLNALGFSVPFGFRGVSGDEYGSQLWKAESFDLQEVLKQCTRFCEHPTFRTDGVYQVGKPFRPDYANACYRPQFPKMGDGGFPLDP